MFHPMHRVGVREVMDYMCAQQTKSGPAAENQDHRETATVLSYPELATEFDISKDFKDTIRLLIFALFVVVSDLILKGLFGPIRLVHVLSDITASVFVTLVCVKHILKALSVMTEQYVLFLVSMLVSVQKLKRAYCRSRTDDRDKW
jgi:hypothetical protein